MTEQVKKENKNNQLLESKTLDLLRIGYKKVMKDRYNEADFLTWAKDILGRMQTINNDIKYKPALEGINQ